MFSKFNSTTKKIFQKFHTRVHTREFKRSVEQYAVNTVCGGATLGGAYLLYESNKPVVSSIMGGTAGCGYGLMVVGSSRNIIPLTFVLAAGVFCTNDLLDYKASKVKAQEAAKLPQETIHSKIPNILAGAHT